ncbi:isoleucine--tRNA ligase [Syntrophomonas palmitatica]|uniref:isoleucine--tRNA ligase n=1 Tax=Syntrophomonas palmitatica TaxID=402877 RepID=UPI0006D1A260|nr:isoleucine--tRNA ligase [Syntrophomonas palmitatica]
MAKGKYDASINLPQTEFPMRANLPTREPEILKFWDEINIYQQIQNKNKGREKFILHDGPPYANGDIHLGHTLNKVLKDIIVKQRSMAGYDSPYVPGWDTHGLPIEQQAIKSLGIDRHRTDVLEFRKHCKEYALKYVNTQREQFRRLGVRGDWEHPYLTLNPQFEAIQIKVFGEMARKGYIYKGLKPVYWCADCETALAEAEVEYNDKTSPSIYVKFKVKDGKGLLPDDAFVIIWTTTPWTLPANTAICVHPEYDYVLLEAGTEKYVAAKGLLETVASALGWNEYKIIAEFKGKTLERAVCRHPFFERDSLIILGEHVTLDAGTGCVHTAPGHGEDDFYVGKEYDLEVISPVDDRGRFTSQAGQFEGLYVHDANKDVIAELEKRNALLKASKVEHQYPHCWRCKNPIIFRATEQWFASVDGFRQNALEEIDKVRWIPSWGRDRIYNMVRDRGDWCISRQRTWGVPIPIFYCESCGQTLVNEQTITRISELFAEHGSDIWFAEPAAHLLPEGAKCENCGSSDFRKETDIMDVWFDSGSSHMAVLESYSELRWPADLYLEGSDQHRGWFNSSLSTAVAVRGQAPYRQVLTHGFLVDEQGYKMSKSLGNVVDPLKMINEMGADILRLWVASADYRNDVSVSNNIIRQSAEAYRKIRNTCRFILGNLYDFDPERDRMEYAQLTELDKWALLKLDKLVRRVSKAYDEYEFHVVFHSVHNFCTIDLSTIYFDILKDKLYCSLPQDPERRAAQNVLYDIINALATILAPVLAFTTEEVWRYLRRDTDPVSVQLLDWPKVHDDYLNDELETRMNQVLALREVVTKSLEEARGRKAIGHSLGARVEIYADDKWMGILNKTPNMDKILIVSALEIKDAKNRPADATSLEGVDGVWVKVAAASGEKCERCWIIDTSVGENHQHPTLCKRCSTVVEQL